MFRFDLLVFGGGGPQARLGSLEYFLSQLHQEVIDLESEMKMVSLQNEYVLGCPPSQ